MNCAIYIDADNVSYKSIEEILSKASNCNIIIKKIFADWTDESMKKWAKKSKEYGFQGIQCFGNDKKQTSDIYMITDIIKRAREGRCFLQGFFTLKCAIWAHIIRKAIKIDDISTRGGNHIPATNKVDREIFEAPTKLRVRSDKPYCLNSNTILSNRKTQT